MSKRKQQVLETRFIALIEGKGSNRGNTCDYYIACNERFVPLKAQTWEEAEAEVKKLWLENEDDEPITEARFRSEDLPYDSFTVVEVSSARDFSDYKTLFSADFEESKRIQEELQRKNDEKELERLQKKLGKKS